MLLLNTTESELNLQPFAFHYQKPSCSYIEFAFFYRMLYFILYSIMQYVELRHYN